MTLSFAKKLASVADPFLSMMYFSARHTELMLQLKELPSIFLKAAVCWLPHAEGNKTSSPLMIFQVYLGAF